ncbi:hypothetical protein LC612_41105 [Nostoc sp. CHAB 5834]|nr:hypothetical protein [Nostoc sp. CHAB 5834]
MKAEMKVQLKHIIIMSGLVIAASAHACPKKAPEGEQPKSHQDAKQGCDFSLKKQFSPEITRERFLQRSAAYFDLADSNSDGKIDGQELRDFQREIGLVAGALGNKAPRTFEHRKERPLDGTQQGPRHPPEHSTATTGTGSETGRTDRK